MERRGRSLTRRALLSWRQTSSICFNSLPPVTTRREAAFKRLLSKEEKTQQLEEQRRMLRTIAEGGDISKFPDTVKNAWYKAFLTYDPLPAIRKVRQPILIFQGAIDHQVTADPATTLEEAARQAGNKNVTVYVFPGLNHLFLKAKTGAFSEYTSLPSSSIGDDVLEILNDWLREKLHVAN